MTVRFILGRSGTGKTRLCIDEIAEALRDGVQTQSLILLVPEQATYQAERALLEYPGIDGFSRLHVLSFQRLAFMLLGHHSAGAEISDIGRQLIVHKILRRVRGELKVFGASAGQPGLAAKIAQTIVEFHQYAHEPADIDQLCRRLEAQGPSLAAMKFYDLALVYKEYIKSLEDGFVNSDNQLSYACRAVAQANLLKGARLWVDGFSGFTGQELEMLKELFKVCEKSAVALCADASRFDYENPTEGGLDPVSIFSPTERTYVKLFEIAKKNSITVEPATILKKIRRFEKSPALAHIEKELFQDVPQRVAAVGAVRLFAAPNARLEAQAAAREIRGLVKDRGLRYRDIAVVASDLDSYQHYIQAAFSDARIPFFIDKAKPVAGHPGVELIGCALQIVSGEFTTADVIAMLKTDLLSISRAETDLLENYCVAFGVEKFHWKEPEDWQFGQADKSYDLGKINALRRKAMEPVAAILAVLSNKDAFTAAQFRDALFGFLDAVDFRNKLAGWIAKAVNEQNTSAADEHRQFLKLLVNLLGELVQIFGDEKFTVKEYANLLARAFEQLTLKLIPPGLDQVLVGSIERSRHPDLKAIFLIGATQKQFPLPVRFDAVLTDDDRDMAGAHGCELADSGAMQLTARQYLTYIAYTRASELLYICYPLNDDKGCAVAVSPFVSALQDVVSDFACEFTEGAAGVDSVASSHELTEMLCFKLGADCDGISESQKELLTGVASAMGQDTQFEAQHAMVSQALRYRNNVKFDPVYVESYFSEKIVSTASRMSMFAMCPFKYFANYILGLKPREIFKLEAPDLGEFYHAVLNKLFVRLQSQKLHFASASQEQLSVALDGAITEVLTDESFVSDYVTRCALNQFIIDCGKDVLADCVKEFAQAARAGSFVQIGSEVPFGYDTSPLNKFCVPIDAKHTLNMRGKIDRVDVCANDNCSAVIFDYKTSGSKVNWSKIYGGLEMQLLVYMRAVSDGMLRKYGPLKPAGAFYLPIDSGTEKAEYDDFETCGEKFKRKARGLIDGQCTGEIDKAAGTGSKYYNFRVTKNDGVFGYYNQSASLRPEHFEALMRFVDHKLAEFGKKMLCGEFSVMPYRLNKESPCVYCDFGALCRFDWRINEYNFVETLDKKQAIAKIEEVLNG